MEIEPNQAQKEGEMMFDITSWKDAGSAIDAFKQNQETITQQLAHINVQLENMFWRFADDRKNWGYPGSQGYVMEQLNEIIEFLGAEGLPENPGNKPS